MIASILDAFIILFALGSIVRIVYRVLSAAFEPDVQGDRQP